MNAEHDAAVARRMATLSAELAAVRGEPPRHTQIRAQDQAPDLAEPPVLPVPGRHSARQTRAQALLTALPLTGAHVAVLALLGIVAAATAGWFAWSARSQPVREAVADGGSPPPSSLVELSSTEPAQEPVAPNGVADEVTVDVAGKVRQPGIAVLPVGARVVDALEAAGGARPGVNTSSLNLARVLVDGEQILVGVQAPAGVAGSVGTTPDGGGALVNLNTADATTLETLPGVGPVTAGAILTWRDTNGAFTTVDELLEVDGIGDATLAEIAPHVTI